jgi:phage I-like protein
MHLLPSGGEPIGDSGFTLIRGRDGREFLAPPLESIGFTEPIPIDINHGTQRAEGFEARAVGWIEGFEVDSQGLFGLVRWLDEGRGMVESLQFRNQSPALRIGETGIVEGIVAAGLTNAPNLELVALASEEYTMATPTASTVQLCSQLGIPADSDSTTILAGARKGYVLETELNSAQAALKAEKAAAVDARAELAARDAAAFEHKKEAIVGLAVKEGRCEPGEKAGMLELCSTEAGLSTVETMLNARKPATIVETNAQGPSGPRDGSADTRTRLAIKHGISKETWAKHSRPV